MPVIKDTLGCLRLIACREDTPHGVAHDKRDGLGFSLADALGHGASAVVAVQNFVDEIMNERREFFRAGCWPGDRVILPPAGLPLAVVTSSDYSIEKIDFPTSYIRTGGRENGEAQMFRLDERFQRLGCSDAWSD